MKTDTQRIEILEKQVQMLMHKLDEVRRGLQMSPVLDDQLMAINARSEALARGQAA